MGWVPTLSELSPANQLLLLLDGTLLHSWCLLRSSGEEPSIPLFLHSKGNNQVLAFSLWRDCKISRSSFETKLDRVLLQGGRQRAGLALLVWKSEEWVAKGHLKMSTRLNVSLEIQIYMCKNIYWACFAVACFCHFCQIMSQEYHWNSRSCFFFNTFELGCSLFQKCSFLPHWKTWWMYRNFLGYWITTEAQDLD